MSKTTRLEEVARREGRVWDLTFFLTLGWIVFGALPLLAMMIVELISGSLPSAANPHPAGYPAFTGPWWAMYPLVGLQLYATALAFPLVTLFVTVRRGCWAVAACRARHDWSPLSYA